MSAGLLQSAQDLLDSALGLARTRLELFSTELQEELTRLAPIPVHLPEGVGDHRSLGSQRGFACHIGKSASV